MTTLSDTPQPGEDPGPVIEPPGDEPQPIGDPAPEPTPREDDPTTEASMPEPHTA